MTLDHIIFVLWGFAPGYLTAMIILGISMEDP